MTSVHFRTPDLDLEVRGSESFVLRQLMLLAPALGPVERDALGSPPPAPASDVAAEPAGETAAAGAERPEGAGAPAPGEPVEAVPAFAAPPARETAPAAASVASFAPSAVAARAPEPPVPHPRNGDAHAPEPDALQRWYRSLALGEKDQQMDAALYFAYYLQRKEGLPSVRISDLLRCCSRAGVDSRNFHRALGVLSRRGLLEEVRHGSVYRISDQGIETVEERLA